MCIIHCSWVQLYVIHTGTVPPATVRYVNVKCTRIIYDIIYSIISSIIYHIIYSIIYRYQTYQ